MLITKEKERIIPKSRCMDIILLRAWCLQSADWLGCWSSRWVVGQLSEDRRVQSLIYEPGAALRVFRLGQVLIASVVLLTPIVFHPPLHRALHIHLLAHS
jgi:hypothetical protein